MEEGRGGELARCWEEMRGITRREALKGWEEKRKEYWEERGWELREVERKRDEGQWRGEEIWMRERERQRDERWGKIGETRYNNWHGKIKGVGLPGYLRKGWGESR